MLSVLASCSATAIPRRRKADTKSDLAVMQQNKFWPNCGPGVNGYTVLLCRSLLTLTGNQGEFCSLLTM